MICVKCDAHDCAQERKININDSVNDQLSTENIIIIKNVHITNYIFNNNFI